MSKPYRIAYMRTSTDAQETAIQLADLQKHGYDRIFTDEGISGKVKARPELMQALAALRPGDELVVWKLDRMGRSAAQLLVIIDDLMEKGINFVSLREAFDLSTPVGRAMYGVAAVFAQMERETIEERRKAGIKLAREKGVKFGRKSAADPTATRKSPDGIRVIDDRSGRLAKAMMAVAGGMSLTKAAKEHGIGKATLHRHLEAKKQGAFGTVKSDADSERKSAPNGQLNGCSVH